MDKACEFTRLTPEADWPWPVYRHGSGPPVVVVHELMGLTPEVVEFGRRLVAEGFTVYLPVLGGPAPATNAVDRARAMVRICVSREIHLFKTGATSPVVAPLRRLTAYAARQSGTAGAGVVGMCFSGGFALALAADEPVRAGVAAQPSLPVATRFTPRRQRDLGLSPGDLSRLQARLASGDTGVYVTRFSADRLSPPARAAAVEELLRVDVDTVPSGPGTPFRAKEHSVLALAPAKHENDPPAAERLRQTYDRIVAFLHDRLDG